MLLRCVAGRPVSAVTLQLLAWLPAWWAAAGKTARRLVWDKASWHGSQAVRAWPKAHTWYVKQAGSYRVVGWPLPVKSPWLNRIEPNGVHGKRAIAESAQQHARAIAAYEGGGSGRRGRRPGLWRSHTVRDGLVAETRCKRRARRRRPGKAAPPPTEAG